MKHPPTPADFRRRQVMLRRKTVQIRRKFDVRYLGERKLEYTCRTCGDVTVKDYDQEPTGRTLSPVALAKLAAYQTQGGASDICAVCTKKRRDELYPLK